MCHMNENTANSLFKQQFLTYNTQRHEGGILRHLFVES